MTSQPLETLLGLPAKDAYRLRELIEETRTIAPRTVLVSENQPHRTAFVIARGWGVRYKALDDGRRQILDIVLPGDTIGIDAALFPMSEHFVASTTSIEAFALQPAAVYALASSCPAIALAIYRGARRRETILGEHVLRLGRRSSFERIGHLLLELFQRLKPLGLAREQPAHFDCPLTQEMFADLLGLSAVHVNRTFRELRMAGLVQFESGKVLLPDVDALRQASRFSPNYLAAQPTC